MVATEVVAGGGIEGKELDLHGLWKFLVLGAWLLVGLGRAFVLGLWGGLFFVGGC